MSRTFEDRVAVRESVPLLVGLYGPSGGGKTYSALRLASGFQRVCGGEIFVVDTEARRALHYADTFRFQHVVFDAPFGPLDYLAAAKHCAGKGAKVIIIDSMSHEHEGPGGVLEMHEAECDRLSKAWKADREKVKMSAWVRPKQERRRLITAVLQMPVHWIFCFRAKEKLKVVRGRNPEPMGYMPIGAEEFLYEMTMTALLLPGAGGVPTWQPTEMGERAMVKLPKQFRTLVLGESGPLSEEVGQRLALWASGASGASGASSADIDELIARHASGDPAVRGELKHAWKTLSEPQRGKWTTYIESRRGKEPGGGAPQEGQDDA